MTKQGVKGKYQTTLNEKYEMYLNSMRRMINTRIHKTKSANYNEVMIIYYHLDLGGTVTVHCNAFGTYTARLQLSY